MSNLHSRQNTPYRWLGLFWSCVAIICCAYLIEPIFHSVHLEGFTAQTQSIALLHASNPGLAHDPYLPIVSQFIFQTRSAVVDALSLIYKAWPQAGDIAYRGLVIASFAVLVASSVLFAKRWNGVPVIFSVVALVLTQGIAETAFFFNDNIVSAAFAITSLTLISYFGNAIALMVAGISLAAAILARVDAVFVLPAVVGIVFHSTKINTTRLARLALVGAAAFLVLAFSAIAHEFSLVDAFVVARRFVLNIDSNSRWLWVRVLFLGLAVLPVLVIGTHLVARKLVVQRSYFGILTFVAYPAALLLAAPKATEIRYIFPLLSPFIAMHVGTGLQWIWRQWQSGIGSKATVAKGVTLYIACVMLVPPTIVQLRDGPRALLGRFWTPALWRNWQNSADIGADRFRELAQILDDQQVNIVISTHYNDEFYLRLRLIESGFIPVPTTAGYAGCNGFSLFRKGRSDVIHVRTDPQYKIAPVSIGYNAALQIASLSACKTMPRVNGIYVSTFGENNYGIRQNVYGFDGSIFPSPLSVRFPDTFADSKFKDKLGIGRSYGILSYKQLDVAQFELIQENAARRISENPDVDPRTGMPVTIEDYRRYYLPIAGPTVSLLRNIRHAIVDGSLWLTAQ